MSNVSFSDSSGGESGTLVILDADGVPVTPSSPPSWEADDPSIVNLVVNAGGMSAFAQPAAPPKAGTANVTITATDSEGKMLTFATAVTVTTGSEEQLEVEWQSIKVQEKAEGQEEEGQEEESSYQDSTVAELKEELAERDLPKSGKKDDLVARLEEDDQQASE